MTKREFLEKLQEALQQDLPSQDVLEQIRFYEGYIDDEIKKGRLESDVLEELGDPWAISRTIVDSAEREGKVTINTPDYQENSSRRQREERQESGAHVYRFDTWWKKLLLLLAVVAVVILVVSMIVGVISFMAPILVPVLIVLLILRIIGNYRRW